MALKYEKVEISRVFKTLSNYTIQTDGLNSTS